MRTGLDRHSCALLTPAGALSCPQVLGFDTDPEVIKALEEGDNYLEHLPQADALFRHLADSPTFTATSDMGRLREADAVLICVPTPLGEALYRSRILDYDLVRQLREEMDQREVMRGVFDADFVGESQHAGAHACLD